MTRAPGWLFHPAMVNLAATTQPRRREKPNHWRTVCWYLLIAQLAEAVFAYSIMGR